jgi:hypothetical protein
MEATDMLTEIWWGTIEGKRSLRRPRLRLENNIKMYHEKYHEIMWSGFMWLRRCTSRRYVSEYGNVALGWNKCSKFIEMLRIYQLFKMDCVPM